MEIIFSLIKQNPKEALSLASFGLSIISIILSIILSQREDPNIMPYGNTIDPNTNHLEFIFLNTSQFNIHNLTILINGFDSDLNEMKEIDFQNKYLFSIGEKTNFNYGFNLVGDVSKNFYLRVRFKGNYNSRFPILKNRTINQSFWYSIFPLGQNEDGKISLKISTTNTDEVEKIKARYELVLQNYDKNIDKKFK